MLSLDSFPDLTTPLEAALAVPPAMTRDRLLALLDGLLSSAFSVEDNAGRQTYVRVSERDLDLAQRLVRNYRASLALAAAGGSAGGSRVSY